MIAVAGCALLLVGGGAGEPSSAHQEPAPNGGPAADASCGVCLDAGQVPCDIHADLWTTVQDLSFYSEWAADEFPCCAMLGMRECADCARDSAVAAIRRDHVAWRERSWGRNLASGSSVPVIAQIIERLSVDTDLYVASTKHFFVVSDHDTSDLRRAQLRELSPELERLQRSFPDAVDTDRTLQPQEAMLLNLQRCEDLHDRFLAFLGLDEDSFQPRTPGIEVFFLSNEANQRQFEFLHDGASRCFFGPERFSVSEVSLRSHFGDTPNPADTCRRAVLSHRGAAGMLAQFMWADYKFGHSAWMPQFLELGIAYRFEIDATGKAVFSSHGSEMVNMKSGWIAERWNKEMYRLVRKKEAPPVQRLIRLPGTGSKTTFDDRVSAWSLVTYLHSLHGAGAFLAFLQSMRAGSSVAKAVEECFDMTEEQLNDAWQGWVRKSRGRELRPNPTAVSTLKDTADIRDQFQRHWRNRDNPKKVSLDECTAAIATLIYLPPEEAAELLFEVVRRGNEVTAAMGVETFRSIREPEMADLLAAELLDAGKANEAYLGRLIRCAGAFEEWSEALLPPLLAIRASPSCPDLVRARIARTFGELRDPDATDALLADTRNLHHLVRAEAVSALAKVSPVNGKEVALQLLADPSWHVRIASVDVFEELSHWDTVPYLIRQMAREAGRLREDILETLRSMTGTGTQAPHATDDPREWNAWWERTGKTLSGRAEAESPPDRSRTSSAATARQLLGGKIYSKKFIFLIDISASMFQQIWTLDPGLEERSFEPKINFVRNALVTKIEELSEEEGDRVLFNVVVFAGNVEKWRQDISESTRRNKRRAVRWLQDLDLDRSDRTGLHSALDWILERADRKLDNGTTESAVDTVYLLSDGMPSVGITDPAALSAWMKERNRMHRIRLNIISIGATDTNLDFLERFAEENDGRLHVVEQ